MGRRGPAHCPPPISCGNGVPGGVNCLVSKSDLKQARNAYLRGRKLQDRNQLLDAFTQFDEATRLVPQDIRFLTARELVKGQLVFNHIESGNGLMAREARLAAAIEFRAALDLDPENQFARERLVEATREAAPLQGSAILPSLMEDVGEIELAPKADKATFHFIGDVRGLFTVLAASYGISVQFDDSLQNRQVRFTIDDVDFFTALRMASQVSKTMWSPLGAHQILVAPDTPENHKTYDHMSLARFTMPPHSAPTEATEFVNTLRTMFDLRFIAPGQTANVLEVRAPQKILAGLRPVAGATR